MGWCAKTWFSTQYVRGVVGYKQGTTPEMFVY